MTVTIRLFALARDLAGATTIPLELPDGATVAQARAALNARIPALAALAARSFLAVNDDYAPDDAIISPNAELALIPPVSGGSQTAADRRA